ncbi:MAG: ABC transporter ATP-binding protein [Paracoccaceae bacterium]
MAPIISISKLTKQYDSGTKALDEVSLEIEQGEILALLGPNGAGKTTLISAICGLVTPTSGEVHVGGHSIATDFRAARALIGLVPQEIAIEPFEKVLNTVRFSRGLFGKPRDEAYLEKVLRALSLWDKRNSPTKELSGGMKRRVLIAKALSHEPKVLFLDEPSAGVDVGLRREMWQLVRDLRDEGVTIILTTHYIEEAEEMADRIGVIDKGRLMLVQNKADLMKNFGRKQLRMELGAALEAIPEALAQYELTLESDGMALVYEYDTRAERTGITRLIADLAEAGISVRDLDSEQSSLEDVFLGLLEGDAA